MNSDFFSVFFQCIFVLLLLALVMAGIDLYFTLSTTTDFFSIFQMNVIFTLGGGVIMLLVFILMMRYETRVLKIFRDDKVIIRFGLFVSCILMFFLKNYLMTRYGITPGFPNLIILVDLALMMFIPLMVGYYIKEFGKAFAH